MACDPKVVMTIEIGENGEVLNVKGGEGRKVETFEDDCGKPKEIPVGTIEKFEAMTVFCAHNSPRCWYFYSGRWWKVC